MRWQATAIRAAALVVTLLIGCRPHEEFCTANPIACEGDGCADAGALPASECITFEEAAELAKSRLSGVHKLTITVDPPLYGFVGAGATDSRSICKENTCYLYTGASAVLHAVSENQALFVGWSGCSTSTDSEITVYSTGRDLECTARFAAAFIVLQASSTGWTDAPIHVTSSYGCDSTNGCITFYGGSFTLTAPTNSAYRFVGWSGCSSSTDPEIVLSNVTGPLPACVAQYEPVTP